ncbi:hypothetical protein HGO38_01545 [Rhizobium sp. CG5]|uniref:DUF6950 family protein n=1 Tax=Rhizobium sp. CG5 TaxID=2726076 RepID=UPI002034A264|nr:hypothetical protein [Rhizobium sp. CG5]MCM2472160.1 hypothetical protein [Rhizobium sp. CG5]
MSDLIRLPDWRARFDAQCDRMRLQPFSWADNDCAIGLAGNLVLALTGVDVVAAYRGRYSTRVGAIRCLRGSGFATLGDLVASLLPEHAHASMARVGDIVALPDDGPFSHGLGVVNGERVFVLTDAGFGTVDRAQAVRAFKVG